MENLWVLALDIGFRRSGVAVAQRLTGSGRPLTILRKPVETLTAADFAPFIRQWPVQRLLLGWPEHADGSPHPLHGHLQKLAGLLQEQFHLPVIFVNEYLTSHEAHHRLGQKNNLDAMAALIIAEDYLNSL